MLRYLAATLILVLAIYLPSAYAEDGPLEVKPGFRLGAGWGPPYGGVGINFETALLGFVGVVAGIGGYSAGTGYMVGARVYPLGREIRLSPRLGAYTGVVGVIEKAGQGDDTHLGSALGAGLDWNLNASWSERKDTLDLEVLWVDDDVPDGFVLKGGNVQISIGYGFRF